ncbi:MAG: redox-sensing transcriptional repressor Rex [Anaerolineaceae bacterium]|jgi:redox-sensing transcriptional repressor
MPPFTIPEIVISRLPVYMQKLNQMLREGHEIISSKELAENLGITATQIRKDLSYFGGFGKQGFGYNIVNLLEELRQILNLTRPWKVALFGIGNLGQAIMHYRGFARNGFEIVLAFDNNPDLIGTEVLGLRIQDEINLEDEIQRKDIKIAIITTPASEAQRLMNRLVTVGIKSVLNYAPIILIVPEDVKVTNIDPVLALQKMAYYLE